MNKFLYALTAGAAALVLTSGSALAADQTRPNEEPQPRAAENQPGDTSTVTRSRSPNRTRSLSR